MIRSMTGFGRGAARLGDARLTAEVRCVNGRHLDVRVRLPRELAESEAALKEIARRAFGRGQVDLSIRLPAESLGGQVSVDLEAARGYLAGAAELQRELDVSGGLSAEVLMRMPGVAVTREPDSTGEEAAAAIAEAAAAACAAAAEMRAREGESLDVELRQRISAFAERVEQIAGQADEIRKGLRERLDKRLASLAPQIEVEPARLEQEVVLYADRMDVTEEIVRLRSHLAQFRETLDESGPVGRKLEFLIQELGREVNTVGSKAGRASLTRSVVELKTELEKLREQVLNVE
ncbi:MAG: YicC family protein [Deltaproteobacteria bacterium]|nr:YicC family protein [Deltaproteobacteria bacterium]MBW2414471.1 YicC family protein [Deltaproteobacteria bacterium]